MILTALLKIVYYLVYAIGGVFLLLPDVSIPVAFSNNMIMALSYTQVINSFFPVSELLYTICGIFLLYEIAYLTLKVFNWVIRKIPTIS